tara:strand:- start:17182 stop:18246 length:1065 start_codon:yes stop_codon:yes gene_type:complete
MKTNSIMFILMTVFSALSVSAVAAYFSIVGLITIFPAAALAIMGMGIVLEIAKLVAASWVYQYWDRIKFLMKTYMVSAVIILSLITSLGIFGFLSRAHIDQVAVYTDQDLNMEVIEFRLDSEKDKLTAYRDRIEALDLVLLESRRQDRNYVTRTQRDERARINADIDESIELIDQYNEQLLPLRMEQAKMEAELGPINYISELFYGETGEQNIDSAVRIIILLLIFVFDPLAIIMVLAANIAIREYRGERITAVDMPEDPTQKDFELETADKPDRNSWAAKSTQNDPTHQISDGVRTQDDLHIDIELPPDGTMTKNMLQGPLEWQEQKYGEDAKMDPKKEERLQWLIDKKKRKK